MRRRGWVSASPVLHGLLRPAVVLRPWPLRHRAPPRLCQEENFDEAAKAAFHVYTPYSIRKPRGGRVYSSALHEGLVSQVPRLLAFFVPPVAGAQCRVVPALVPPVQRIPAIGGRGLGAAAPSSQQLAMPPTRPPPSLRGPCAAGGRGGGPGAAARQRPLLDHGGGAQGLRGGAGGWGQ